MIWNKKISLPFYSSGQILLLTIIIIFSISSAILLTTMKSLISTMLLLPEKIAYHKSYYAGVSCMDIALLNFRNNISYIGNENIAISPDMTCLILPVESSFDNKYIKTTGISGSVQRNFLATIKKIDANGAEQRYKLEKIEEVDSF